MPTLMCLSTTILQTQKAHVLFSPVTIKIP